MLFQDDEHLHTRHPDIDTYVSPDTPKEKTRQLNQQVGPGTFVCRIKTLEHTSERLEPSFQKDGRRRKGLKELMRT